MIEKARQWARRLKRDVTALWLAARDPRVPVIAKVVAGAVAAYAVSPVDLIPDFIPVLGLLDNLVIVPLGIMLAVRLIPQQVLANLRTQAAVLDRPQSRAGLLIVGAIWAVAAALLAWLALSRAA